MALSYCYAHCCHLTTPAERREDLINEKWSGGKPLQRPKTTSAVARRMVSHALGVRLRESEKGIKEMKQRVIFAVSFMCMCNLINISVVQS